VDCPVCANILTTTAGRITVDACEGGCGGIWFDRYELMRVDEADESAGEGLLEIERDPHVVVALSKRLNCPKCSDVVMMRHFSSASAGSSWTRVPTAAGTGWIPAS
jgi:hypothetical protein